jgi:hypothetical protein
MDATEVQQRLAQRQQAWDQAPASTGFGDDWPPDGDYQATILEFDFIDTEKAGLFLKVVFQVENDATYRGRRVEQLYTLEDPDRLKYTKQALATMGVDTAGTALADIYPDAPLLNSLLDTPVEIAVKSSEKVNEKTGQRYRNAYVNKRLGPPLRAQSDLDSDASGFTHRGKPDETLAHDGTPIDFLAQPVPCWTDVKSHGWSYFS